MLGIWSFTNANFSVFALAPYGSSLLSVPGIGPVTVGGFLAETGDLAKYQHSRQIQKLAGLNLKENISGNNRSFHPSDRQNEGM